MLVCVQCVIAAPRVRQRSQRDVHGVRLRAHDADVLVYDISVRTCCGNFRASVALSPWVLSGPSLLDWSDAEYDKLRELMHYDHGASAVNHALYGMKDTL